MATVSIVNATIESEQGSKYAQFTVHVRDVDQNVHASYKRFNDFVKFDSVWRRMYVSVYGLPIRI